jgi:hypothetical protein
MGDKDLNFHVTLDFNKQVTITADEFVEAYTDFVAAEVRSIVANKLNKLFNCRNVCDNSVLISEMDIADDLFSVIPDDFEDMFEGFIQC